MTYHYTMCGLDNVRLRNGYREHDTDYGKGVSIEHADALDRAIAEAVIMSHARMRGQEVRFLRSLLDKSQADLARELGVQRVTVARWEGSPTTPIPGAADRALRALAAKALFGGECLGLVVDTFSEITDDKPGELYLSYLPDEKVAEPSLFPADEKEGWRAAA